jgi:uncharacterized protein
MAAFDPFAGLPLLRQPLLMVVGREAVTAWMSVAAYQAVTRRKRMAWVEGASHVDLYDRGVDQAVAHLAGFFEAEL